MQVTPPGSAVSIQFGRGLTDASPGSVRGTYLVVTDIEASRAELAGNGVEVGSIVHKAAHRANWGGRFTEGVDPERTDYASFFTIGDPDGNTWTVQEVGH